MTSPGRRRWGASGAVAAIEQLLHGRESVFFTLLEQAGANVARAAALLCELFAGFPETHAIADEIVNCERAGDQISHELIRRLNEEFVTPIDREDILKLASALDDIVDFTEETAGYLTLYRIEAPMIQAQALAQVLADATRRLDLAIGLLSRFEDISAHTIEIHRLENEGDRIVRGAIASLFEGQIDPIVVIRWKDIFERLEDAIDSAERAAFVLESVLIKNV
ncbi:MAG TPA: DUF47 family protein [Solirubrobacteraceae bacterium]|jgi:hypothetical protein|nr:DUF47 family protein [Solirubrobacteraceae bacterium]